MRIQARQDELSRVGFGRLLVSHIHQSEQKRFRSSTRIAVALVIGASFAFLLPGTASTRTSQAAAPRPVLTPMSLDGMAREVVYLVNLERAQHDLPPLRVNERLIEDAKLQANQIVATGVLEHFILGAPYPTPSIRAEVAGYAWNALGENLAFGYTDAPSAVAAWMRSPGHRANILANGYSETGVVLAPDRQGQLIFVQTFGSPE
ncbi:MAG TPA: CAP domain-containing protein [Gemmatimonadaceae bacterium]|jgi:uncharacterized protein YkwD